MMSLGKQKLYLKCQSDLSSWKDWIKRLNFGVEFWGSKEYFCKPLHLSAASLNPSAFLLGVP